MLPSNDGFASLDLSGAKATSGMSILQRGIHDVVCKEASFERVGNTNNRKVKAVFVTLDGAGQITHNFNVVHSSAKAQEIGRDQLKSFLTHGKHPNPDHPGDINTLVGLRARVFVDSDGTYEREGRTYESWQVKRFLVTDGEKPAVAAKPKANGAAAAHNDIDDDIPF